MNDRDREQQGDLLLPGFARRMTIGNAAFLTADPSRPGIGFGFLTLRPGVTGVTARFGDGTARSLRLVTVSVCGQRFRLAGFAAPRQGVIRFTARSPQGRPIGFHAAGRLLQPRQPLPVRVLAQRAGHDRRRGIRRDRLGDRARAPVAGAGDARPGRRVL